MPREKEIEFQRVPINDYMFYVKCDDCKAIVMGSDMEDHRVFHAKIDELIEWAQGVSQMFVGEANEGS